MQELVNSSALLALLLVVLFAAAPSVFSKKQQAQQTHHDSAESHSSGGGVTPGLPIAIIYDTNTSMEIRDNIDKAIRNINSDIKFGRNKWAVKVVTIDTSDNYELMRAVCQQMSRGVLAIFGTTSWSSVNVLNSFTSYYGVPFISWSHLARTRMPAYKLLTDNSTIHGNRKFYRFYRELSDYSFVPETEQQQLGTKRVMRVARNNGFDMENEYDVVDYSNNDELLLESLEVDDQDGNLKDNSPTQVYLRPDLALAMIELISSYGWTNIYYIYNHEQAIVHLESLFDYQLKNSGFAKKIVIRKIKNINNCRNMLRAIESSNDMNNVNDQENNKIIMIVDLDSKKSYLSFLNQIKDLGMTKTRYHYILATLGIYELDLNDFRHGGVTITGFSIVDYYSINTIKVLSDMVQNGEPLNKIANIPHEAALVIDGLVFFSRRVNAIIGSNMSRLFGMDNVSLRRAEIYIDKNKGINCSSGLSRSQPKWPLGNFLLDKLKSTENVSYYEGLTGPVSFGRDGRRRNFTIGIYKVGLNQPLSKIGQYSSTTGLSLSEEKKNLDRAPKVEGSRNRKLVIVSIKDDPFLMFRNEAGKNFTGNDRFTGYCADLAKRLSEMLNFTYDFRLVKDNKFGARDNEGNWDGIVGELIRHEADIAVAPLTISSQRERVIEFSMPFMNIGISIMIKKPKKEKPGVFSFMEPLDSQIWLCVILAYISVTIIMFLVSRFSPYEWHYDEDKNAIGLNNDFNILNTLWFNLAAVMQQGVDLAPRSCSGRLVASVWWFFTLILISSYTANLAAFLTVERMVSPIESAEDLVKQSSIQYGTLEGGSTKEFFKNSRVPTYQRMWASMEAWKPSVFVSDNMQGFQRVRESKGKYAYLLESSLNEYLNERLPCDTMKVGNDLDSKGYGIATPIRSEWRDPINLAVLQLKEEGFLDGLKTKYWYDTSECGSSAGSSKDTSQSALNLINVAGIFYILIIGLILSVLVATLELMYKAKIQSEKNKIEFSEAVKSKMRLSISGYEDSIKDFRKKNGIGEEVNQLTPFPT